MMVTTFFRALLCMSFFISPFVQAGLIVERTRAVVEVGSSSEFVIGNNTKSPFAMQAWVEDEEGNEPGRNVQVSPSFSMIKEGGTSSLRLVSFAKDVKQEQLYYLYVQEIPPKAEKANTESQMQIAVRYKIKVFVRPASIREMRRGAEHQIVARYTGTGLTLKNPTPFYFALTKFEIGDQTYENDDIGLFKPFSTVKIDNVRDIADEIKINFVSDRGALKTALIEVKR